MADEDLPPSYVKRCKRILKKFNKGFKAQASHKPATMKEYKKS